MDRSRWIGTMTAVATGLICGNACAAQNELPRVEASLVKAVASQAAPETIWAEVQKLGNLNQNKTGLYLECSRFRANADSDSAVGGRHVLESDGEQEASLIIDPFGVPASLQLDRHTFIVDEDGVCRYHPRTNWGFTLNGRHAEEPFIRSPASESRVIVEPGPYLESLLDDTECLAKWDSTSLCLTVADSAGHQLLVRFRTPGDALHYGSMLSEIAVRGMDEQLARYAVSLSRFQTAPHLPTRLRLPSPNRVISTTSAEPFVEGVIPKVGSGERTKRKLRICMALTEAVTGRSMPLRITSIQASDNRPVMELLSELSLAEHCLLTQFLDRDGRNRTLVAQAVIFAWMKIENELGLQMINRRLFPDDPCMIRAEFEAITSSFHAESLCKVSESLLVDDAVPEKLRVQIATYLSEWGPPAKPLEASGIQEYRASATYLNGLISSGWNIPVHTKGLAALSKLIGEKEGRNNGVRFACIRALIRSGEIERVPDDDLDDWYEANITKATFGIRWRCICLMVRTKSGRRELLKQMSNSTGSIRAHIAAALKLQCDAVEALKRYDFMTEEERREIIGKLERLALAR